jgi:RHS repeat-associated protein
MLSDGANAFSWNARNQVATLNNVNLQYDGFGRRTKNLQNTSFLFDGANAVQELSGSTATANLISGGIDEIFTRADSTGAYTQLKDALGSTIALVDASGNLFTQYSYDPFGNTSVSGATNANAFQYTGRENEGNGLYFYRARYYSPMLGRFVNEDPLGFGANSTNFYGYVHDDPMNLVDSIGLQSMSPGEVGYRFGQFKDWLQGGGDAGDMFSDWATGSGPATRNFGPETVQVQSMKHAPGTDAARDFFLAKNNDNCGQLESVTNYRAGFGLTGLWNAGLDPTQQFVGNYSVNIIPNGNHSATFVLNNTTSMTSFLYGIAPSYSRDPFGSGWSLPGGNMSQTFTWTETFPSTLSGRGCGCK